MGIRDIIIQEELFMNKTELVASVAEQGEVSKKDAEKVLKGDIQRCILESNHQEMDIILSRIL